MLSIIFILFNAVSLMILFIAFTIYSRLSKSNDSVLKYLNQQVIKCKAHEKLYN